MINRMTVILLTVISRLFQEFSFSSGKKAFQKHRETVYSLGFLTYTCTLIFFLIGWGLGQEFRFDRNSLPILIPRIFFEVLIAHLAMVAILKASRTTNVFLSNITIPLLLLSDVLLSYAVSGYQMVGIGLIILSLLVLFNYDRASHKGMSWVIAVASLSALTTTLYKYDITHFNSVAAEQIIVLSFVTGYFIIMAKVKTSFKHWRYALSAKALIQSSSMGFSHVLSSYAYSLAPASVVVSLLNGSSIIWGTLFGRIYFHEKALKTKIAAFALIVCGMLFLLKI